MTYQEKIFRLFIGEIFAGKIFGKKKTLKDKKDEEILKKIVDDSIPRIGIVGVAGSGKTTTIQGLFGFEQKRNKTEKVNEYEVTLSGGKAIFLDFPGIGDWLHKKDFIENQYRELLPKCDVIIWVIDASSRVRELDESYLLKLDASLKNKIIIGLNKVNMVGHFHTWLKEVNLPSAEQQEIIDNMISEISTTLSLPKDIFIPYSAYYVPKDNADYRYNLTALTNKILKISPKFVLATSILKTIENKDFNKKMKNAT